MRWALWQSYLAVGLLAASGYWLLPDGLAQDALYLALGASSVLAIAIGVRRNAPIRRAPWVLMGAGQLVWVVGDAIDSWYQDIAHSDAYPTLADAFYLAAYPVIAVGLLLLIRRRRSHRDLGGLLDSAIVTAGLGLLSWVLVAGPTITAAEHHLTAALVGVAYPIADVVLVGLLIRLVTTPGGRTPAYRLLFLAIGVLIAGDTTSASLSLWSQSGTRAYDVIWLAAYVVWGAAALHPSMTTLSEPSKGIEPQFSRSRLAVLAAASLIAPGTLAVQQFSGVSLDVWAVVAGSVVLFLLVVGRMNVAIAQLVTANRDRDRLQTSLVYQAAHDSLTDLPNRTQALIEIEAALNRAQRTGVLLGLLFVDLDGFKAVNDSFGHQAGDEVLRVVAARLRDEVRAGDMVARLGGDEFVVLLESLDMESDAVEIARRAIEAVTVPIPVGDGRCARIGASVGMAISQDGSTDAGRLLHEADTAVYRAKAAGRGRVEIFDDALRFELAERSDLEAALRHAIETDQFVLHYQPVVDLATGSIRGYEALVRWDRPGYGLVPPLLFIPTAEASSLICDLDAWVLRHATTQLAQWRQPSQMVAVNISGRHVSDSRIIADVRAALAESGLPPHQLVIEITETVVVEDLLATHHLQQLRELGVVITIDDFGTGYNSIARLQHLPVDIIKIDRSFLDMGQQSAKALLELMIFAAHAFGLPVVAEGVEHPGQLELLRSMNCEFVQGYYLSHPLTAAEVVLLEETISIG